MGGKVGAGGVSRKQAPEIERLAALEAVDAEIDQRLFRPAAEIDWDGVSPSPAPTALTPSSAISSFTCVDTEPSPATLVAIVS